MQTVMLIQARLGSSRLPGKVLKNVIGDLTLLELIYSRILYSDYANSQNVYFLISNAASDDELAFFLDSKQIKYYRGEENNVYNRYYSFLASLDKKPDYFFRICCDNPFIEPRFINEMCDAVKNDLKKADYVSFAGSDKVAAIQKKYGLFCEMVNTHSFLNLAPVSDLYAQEHVTPLLYNNSNFIKKYLPIPDQVEASEINLSVDTEQDLQKCRRILKEIGNTTFHYTDLLPFFA